MRNAMQLKALVKKMAREKRITAQLVLQNYMLERLLERISVSSYRDVLIVKGGFLIASMVGLDTRSTMDMDATIKGMPVSEETVAQMISEICDINVQDGIQFLFKSIGEIREGDDYAGYRVTLTANYPPMSVPLKLDLTTGDRITPKEISYTFKTLFDDREIPVLAYNLETLLAEKLETVISRGDQNTRLRDFYDIFILSKLNQERLNGAVIAAALSATSEKRGSTKLLQSYETIITTVKQSPIMINQWERYRKEFEYASAISFDEACSAVLYLMHLISRP